MEAGYRYRVNVSRGMTGKYGWDVTVERVFPDEHDPEAARQFVLLQQGMLSDELEARYTNEPVHD
jgi:hypothetical protein